MVGGVITRGEVEARLAEALKEKDRRLHNERALSKCAGALLGDYNPASVETSLRALMESANASFGHVDWQDDQNDSSLQRSVASPGPSEELGSTLGCNLVGRSIQRCATNSPSATRSQSKSPISRLRRLRSFSRDRNRLAPRSTSRSSSTGTWAGTLGLGDQSEGRVWDPDEIQMLQMAASLLSSWWQRRDTATRLEGALESRNSSLRLEHAVATASQVLSRASSSR